ncbi:MAG: NusG domain II-containing protein [Oscillospiraceae bacterium]|nr:NusG domain II-containing protein [Oscillospiraceae bacterium]
MKRGDIAVILCLLILAGGLLLPPRLLPPGPLTVYVNGEIAMKSMHVNGAEVEIDGGRARIASSPCPDQLCVHAGWLDKPGQSAVCLPRRVIVELRGARNEVDGVAG